MSDLAFGLTTFNPEREYTYQYIQVQLRIALSQINERLNRLSHQVQKIETGENDTPSLSQVPSSLISPKKIQQTGIQAIKITEQSFNALPLEEIQDNTNNLKDLQNQLLQIQILKSQNSICRALTTDTQKKYTHYMDLPRKYKENQNHHITSFKNLNNQDLQQSQFQISCNSFTHNVNYKLPEPVYNKVVPHSKFMNFEEQQQDLTYNRRQSSSQQNVKKPTIRIPQFSEQKLRQQTIQDSTPNSQIPKLNLNFIPVQDIYKRNKFSLEKQPMSTVQKFQLKENRHEFRQSQSENQSKNHQQSQQLYLQPQTITKTPIRSNSNSKETSFIAQNHSFVERLTYQTPVKNQQIKNSHQSMNSVSPLRLITPQIQPRNIQFQQVNQVFRPNINYNQIYYQMKSKMNVEVTPKLDQVKQFGHPVLRSISNQPRIQQYNGQARGNVQRVYC